MDAIQARKIDDDFYVEYDEENGLWCIFGNNSGFAYSSHASEFDAINYLTTEF